MSRLLILFLMAFYVSLFNTGCSILHSDSLEKSNGYYLKHLQSCGPRASQKAITHLTKNETSVLEVAQEIQDGGGNAFRLILSLFHHEAVQITFPHEIKNFFEKHGFKVSKINSLEDLDPKVDTAIVLIRDGVFTNKWHWLCFPKDRFIKGYFGKDTKIHLIFLITKK